MKSTLVIGSLFTFLMMLGMNTSGNQTCYHLQNTTTFLVGNVQQPNDIKDEKDTKRHPNLGRMRPDRQKPRVDGRNPFASDRPLPENMVEHIMELAKELDPELASQLMTMCEKDPRAFNTIVRKQGRRLGSLIRLREDDPELFEVKVTELKVDAEIYHIAESIRGQDNSMPEIQAHIAELEGLVRVRTALSIRAQTLYIERLKRHLQGLQARLEDTTIRFDEIVGERLEQLLQAVDGESKEEKKVEPNLID
jgi:hypothetical protein